MFYSKRLGSISDWQLQAALDRFDLGTLIAHGTISTGLFGQNLYVTSTRGDFVFRGSPHYEWQLPTERYFANLLYETSVVPVPWPYLVEPASVLFPWPWGYAIMPTLPGSSLAEVYGSLSAEQRASLATAMGRLLSRFHAPDSPICGSYHVASGHIRPFEGGYAGRVVERVRQNIRLSRANGALDEADGRWLECLLDRAASLPEPDRYTAVHEDFNRNNMTARVGEAEVTITGVFDLMTCHFGDGLADLARQICMFLEEADGEVLARAYAQAYLTQRGPLDPEEVRRSLLYMLDERLLVWEYFHRPGHEHGGWMPDEPVRRWLAPYLETWEAVITDFRQ